ncbi:MAG: hypothetical protein Tsb009_29380 [Planctomycetaceae bacterium]
MANEWYYSKGEERLGPVSSEKLKSMADAGELMPDDLIWKEGQEDWKPASQIKGLFSGSRPMAPASPASPPAQRISRSPVLQIPILIGAILYILAMCLPWWSFQVKGDEEDFEKQFTELKDVDIKDDFRGDRKFDSDFNRMNERPAKRTRRVPKKEKMKIFARNMITSAGWYLRNLHALSVKSNIDDFIESEGREGEVDVHGKIWGWNATLGLTAGLFGFLVLPLSLAIIFSESVRRFSFAISFLFAYASFVLLVLAAIWWLDAPGWDMDPVISQHAHIGPYFVMGAGVVVLVFGVLDGIGGLRAFKKSQA